MTKNKPPALAGETRLEAGQLWRMSEAHLKVGTVGKLLVHYKLGKPDAVRTANACNTIKVIEKFLKSNHAVLDSGGTGRPPTLA